MPMRAEESERSTEARDKRLKRLLVSMRSMDGSRSQDFPPGGGGGRGGGGGNRHIRPRSPSYDDYEHSRPRQRGQRQRQGDTSTDEIIRFVRSYHLERESTLLRLQKKAPLPGIGQIAHSMQESNFASRHHERRNSHTDADDEHDDNDVDDDDNNNNNDDEDILLDNEVAAIDAGQRDSLRNQIGLFDDVPFTSSVRGSIPGMKKRHDRYSKTNASYGPPASHHRHVVRPLDNHAHVGSNFTARAHARKGLGRSLKQLPPIARDELPERPTAPSPSLTPPGEGEELDSAGEPVDFIDAP